MDREEKNTKKYTIDDLIELTGFSRRTIRFYIQESIIEPPAGRGRGGFYFESHLSALMRIKELQAKGLNLGTIKEILSDNTSQKEKDLSMPQEEGYRQVWAKYIISDGIELSVRKDIELKDIKKVNELIRILTLRAKEIENDN
ncbi:MAG: MerR family transcriptional regulator [Actinobacteria bacterium]|nr:MerR family transcriptional regulator [Actinomycetota bacterium]